ncbi:uncharacterized protein LOC114283654 [Camellia sinensis]|uniref:uncharacterized protein LOC114283654 n=1 Tax=Camellia sinensis TaxID=4442 RepID=UPI001036A3F2|nr:uncharacterized protein LOC114283654 [Camellia sinensis]
MVSEYSTWLANIVPVPKKDSRIKVRVGFRDLNKASPKDEFLLPHIDELVDFTTGYALFSFMDGFSRYNQILMVREDKERHGLVKGRAVAEFLADRPVKGDEDIEYLFPDEEILQVEEETWKMYFDGTANQYGYGINVLLIAPDDSHIPLAFKLHFKISNNETEYKACITG